MKMTRTITSRGYVHFIEELRALREMSKITQAQLAKRIGKPQSFVSKVESIERRLDIRELFIWMNAIGSDPMAFLAHHKDSLVR